MTRFEAVRALRAAVRPDWLVVSCNGMIGRELLTAGDGPGQFYMIGSMGLASSIGLGLALTRPDRTVIVADGDGNVLMGLGALASVAAAGVGNLHHVVFDNGAHASTGGQRTIADRVALERVALAAGYRTSRRVSTPEALGTSLATLATDPGPSMLLVTVAPGNVAGVGRVEIAPPDLARRFRAAAMGEPR